MNILKTEQIPRYMKVPCIRRQAEISYLGIACEHDLFAVGYQRLEGGEEG